MVRWLGGFGQVEYNYNNVTAFLNLTGSHKFYKRIDYFKKQDLVLEDTTLTQAVGVNEAIWYDGNRYTLESDEARFAETNWEVFPGYTVKLGANWNIDQHHNVFFNTGVLSQAPTFANVFTYDNTSYDLTNNNRVEAVELGYGYRSSDFSLNFNIYNTVWQNKPQSGPFPLDGGDMGTANLIGMNSLHKGIELDFAWKLSDKIIYEFLSSFGDWRWTSEDAISYVYYEQQLVETHIINMKDVPVGDSPQTQIGSTISYNYKINKNSKGYIKLKGMYFDKFFSDYKFRDYIDDQVFSTEDFIVQDPWQIPGYALFSLHMGHNLFFDKSSLHFKLNILNLFDAKYINDADNNNASDPPTRNFDAESASAFFGIGRTMRISLEYKF